MSEMDIEQRVAISLAVGRYLRTSEAFNDATKEFNEACTKLRSVLSEPVRVITKVQYRHYLVTSNKEGDFEVEEIEFI
jgi:hypothetical protein